MSISIAQHKHLRWCCSRKGRVLSDLWLIHSSSSCQANITLSEGSMWHSITMRGCDRTSPFPLHSLRSISDIASLLLHNAVYFSCTGRFHIPLWALIGANQTKFKHCDVGNTLNSELLLSVFKITVSHTYAANLLLSLYFSVKYFNRVINCISISDQ